VQDKRRGTLINTIELSHVSRSCDFSPDARFFVVGYDKGIFEVFHVYDNDGTFFQLECVKLFDLNRDHAVSCLRFTPDGRFLIITCNKDIVVFNAQSEEFEKVGLLKGNSVKVIGLEIDKAS
jgi:WD40 repeat protein